MGARGPIAQQRLSLDGDGLVVLELKRAFSDGTTPVLFEPQDFTAPAHPCARGISASLHVIARMAALVARPKVASKAAAPMKSRPMRALRQ